jgi:HPt (histidine-containing phosphotransfer) domain-containing protein
MPVEQRNFRAEESSSSEVFDDAHLLHYTMNLPDLAAEVVGLFLAQLPIAVETIEQALTPADWKLATHSLKGAAASIGARRLQKLASDLEEAGLDGDPGVRALRLKTLKAAAAEFRARAKQVYP